MINSGYVIKNVSKFYKINNEEHVVFKNISLEISEDDITVILGKSGCGKTTLLRLISGLENTSSGKINFIKENKAYKPKVGLVFQESRLMPWLTVTKNIAFHNKKSYKTNKLLLKLKFKKSDLNNKDSVNVDKYLKMMNLDKFKNSYPNELSGGMAQRVSIARALSFNPDLLLMDEPFSALDYFTRMDMQNEVIKIHECTNKGVIFVTHDIDEAMRIGKKIIIFTSQGDIQEFEINESYNRDLTGSYYGELKNRILNILKE
ncbi:ABC transporter ATP-binding protein [Clostridium beijerinckii]|nr:ABC transporter ATP-binding protein [Clostridium beijerinckii]